MLLFWQNLTEEDDYPCNLYQPDKDGKQNAVSLELEELSREGMVMQPLLCLQLCENDSFWLKELQLAICAWSTTGAD